jgi:hypothetical protein
LNSPPPPFSFIPLPYSWNSFNRSPIWGQHFYLPRVSEIMCYLSFSV